MPDSIEKLNIEMRNLATLTEQALLKMRELNTIVSKNPENTAFRGTLREQTRLVEMLVSKYNELAIAKRAAGSASSPVNTVSTGDSRRVAATPPVTDTFNYDLTLEDFRKYKGLLKALRQVKQVGTSLSNINLTDEGMLTGLADGQKFKLFVDKMGNFARNISGLQRMQFITDPKNAALFEKAGAAGFRPDDFKSMHTYGSGAWSEARFSRNMGGAEIRQNYRMGPSGEINEAAPGRKFQGLSQTLGQDVRSLVLWTAAIGLIYGPINALSEATEELIELQAKLADVSVALADETSNTSEVFNDIYDSAQRAGEGVLGVVDAFGQAYRATGRIADPYLRYNTAIKLTNDALVLSKISTLDQAQAIDTLSAALYQSGRYMDEGQLLLDQWVRVSKVANVDIATLATGVAVLGDSAETAGLSLEQLNALIATIAETSLAGGKEAANIAKALIGNFQSDSAVKELARLGISVTDATGKTREFLDVMQDVAALRSTGIIGNQDFQRLTLALGGGGIRRQKDVAAFIENFGRMQQITNLQEGAGGESAEAMTKKLDTLETSATKLSNSFTSLAQTLGNEGGLLDAFSGLLDVGTGLVDILDTLFEKTGKVAPLLLTVLAGRALLGRRNLSDTMINDLGFGITQTAFLTGQRSLLPAEAMAPFGQGTRDALGRFANIPSLMAIATPAYQNFKGGDSAEGWANLAGGTLGALLGGPIGALAGSAIAEAFVRTTISYETSFANFFAEAISSGIAGAEVGKPKTDVELTSEAFKFYGGGQEDMGKFLAWMGKMSSQVAGFSAETVNQSPLFKLLKLSIGVQEFGTPESFLFDQLKRINPDLATQLTERYAAKGLKTPGFTTSLDQYKEGLSKDSGFNTVLLEMQRKQMQELQRQLIEGDIRSSDYARRTAYLSGFPVAATQFQGSLQNQGNLQDFMTIWSSGNEELINQINQQLSGIDELTTVLEGWANAVTQEITNPLTGETQIMSKEQVAGILDTLKDVLQSTITYGAQQIRVQNIQTPQVFGNYLTPSFKSKADMQLAVQEALKAQQEFYMSEGGGGLTQADYDALAASFEDIAIPLEEAGNIFYEKVSGVSRQFLDEATKKLQEQGDISGAGGPGFTSMDITLPQLQAAVIKANAFAGQLQSQFGYEPNFEDTIIATSDNQITSQHTDMKILQYILQDILDVNRKQLDGMYNFPEGTYAWVPLQAAQMHAATVGGLGGEELTTQETQIREPKLFEDRKITGQMGYEGETREEPIKKGLHGGTEAGTIGTKEMPSPEDAAISGLVSVLSSLFPMLSNLVQMITSLIPQPTDSLGTEVGKKGLQGGTGVNTNPVTRFDIRFESTTQLVVDGRTLAEVVKPYLAEDLSNTEASAGTVTKTYVI